MIFSSSPVLELLLSLLRTDSRTGRPGGRESLLHLREYLHAGGVRDLHIESANCSPFLFARIPGFSPSSKGLLLFSHVDTAGWDESEWSRSPLGEMGDDGTVFGRGALDCKSLAALQADLLVTFARTGTPLRRDLGLVITTDEESGGCWGMSRFCLDGDHLAGFDSAIGEGGGYILSAATRAAVTCQVGECGRVEYTLPHAARMSGQIVDVPTPPRLTKNLRHAESLAGLWRLSPDSLKPTFSVEGGRGTLRVPPEYRVDTIVAYLTSQRLLPSGVEGREIAGSYLTAPRGRLYRSICRLVRRTGRRVVPVITPGYGDGRFLRKHGLKTFGFFPVGLRERVTSIHGVDEHIHRLSLEQARDSLLLLVTESVS